MISFPRSASEYISLAWMKRVEFPISSHTATAELLFVSDGENQQENKSTSLQEKWAEYMFICLEVLLKPNTSSPIEKSINRDIITWNSGKGHQRVDLNSEHEAKHKTLMHTFPSLTLCTLIVAKHWEKCRQMTVCWPCSSFVCKQQIYLLFLTQQFPRFSSFSPLYLAVHFYLFMMVQLRLLFGLSNQLLNCVIWIIYYYFLFCRSPFFLLRFVFCLAVFSKNKFFFGMRCVVCCIHFDGARDGKARNVPLQILFVFSYCSGA